MNSKAGDEGYRALIAEENTLASKLEFLRTERV